MISKNGNVKRGITNGTTVILQKIQMNQGCRPSQEMEIENKKIKVIFASQCKIRVRTKDQVFKHFILESADKYVTCKFPISQEDRQMMQSRKSS